MKTLIVGDLHGEWGRLNQLISKKKPDIILQCGDFGWWPSLDIRYPILYGRRQTWCSKGIKPQGSRVYWCDGNHEEHTALSQTGSIKELYAGIHHASRGSTLVLPTGQTVLFAGGATSIDKDRRTPGRDWFPEENITNEELDRMLSHDRIDIVISHTCPDSFDLSDYIAEDYSSYNKRLDANRVALDVVLEQYSPEFWFFGHWHKFMTGQYRDTKWVGLDYPGHGGRWWIALDTLLDERPSNELSNRHN